MKEFRESGEECEHDRKKSRQHHETRQQPVTPRFSPEEISIASLIRAHEIIEQHPSRNIHSRAELNLAKLAEQDEDLETVQYWTSRLESQDQRKKIGLRNSDPERNSNLAQLYFIGVCLGDEQSFDKLQLVLLDERTTERNDDLDADEQNNLLADIVVESANRGLPADTWINRFARSNDHKLKLKSYYVSYITADEPSEDAICIRYIDEIADAIVQKGMTDEVFWNLATQTIRVHPDPLRRDEIFTIALRRVEKSPDEEIFQEFLMFMSKLLSKSVVSESTVATALGFAVRHAISYPLLSESKIEKARMELSAALFQKKPVDQLIEQLDQSTHYQLSLDIPEEKKNTARIEEYAKADVIRERDRFLGEAARTYAKVHDFESATRCIREIGNEDDRLYVAVDCLKRTQKIQDIDLFKEEENKTEMMQRVIRARELILRQNPEEKTELIRILASDPFMKELAQDFLTTAYKQSIEEGSATAQELLAAVRKRSRDSNYEFLIGNEQIKYGDPDGFQTIYEHLQTTDAQPAQYITLAGKCNKWIKEHD